MTKNWEPLQAEIRRLYMAEDKSLDEVMRLIRGKYDFIASERSYRTQLRKWGYMKYSTQAFPKPKKRAREPNRSRQHPAATLSNPEGVAIFPGESTLTGDLPPLSTLDVGGGNVFITTPNPSSVGVSARQLNAFGHETQAPGLFHLGQNDQDGEGKTQLHRAALSGEIDQVRLLLNAGASVDTQDHLGDTPLHSGVTAQDVGIIGLILKFGAKIDTKNNLGRAPLHLARSSPHLIRALIDQGADPSIQDEEGDTPLHLTLYDYSLPDYSLDGHSRTKFGDCSSAIAILLKAGADVNRRNTEGITPFLQMLDRPITSLKMTKTIQSLLQAGGSVLHNLPDGRTPLQVYLSRTDRKILDYSYFRNRNIERMPETDILIHFLANGAPATTPAPSGKPMIYAFLQDYSFLWQRNFRIGKALFKSLTDDEMKEVGDSSLLGLASDLLNWKGTQGVELIEVLLRRGADPNYCSLGGNTSLLAIFQSHRGRSLTIAAALPTLLDHGANPWQENLDGACALLEAAKKFPEQRFVQMMLEADLRRQESTRRTEFEGLDATMGELWDQWQQAARAVDWDEAKQLILRRLNGPTSKTHRMIKESAFIALAERHVHLAMDKFQDDDNAVELRRKYMAGVFRDCRERDVTLDTTCTDRLVDLCL